MADSTREIRLAARPIGAPQESDFELAETSIPEPADGEVLVRNAYMSVDPYMRSRMNETKSYVPSFRIGEPLQGGAVGQVVASRCDVLAEGDWVNSMYGWREHYVANGEHLMRIDPEIAPVSTALGVLGMPGLTAYVGLHDIGQPKAGETVFVSAASGAVGSVVGQLAKLKGCRVVGSAGSTEKVRHLLEELDFDAAFNYKEVAVADALRDACPDGIDIYFENVGGEHLECALACMNLFGRVALCGLISQYNATEAPRGPANFPQVLVNRLLLKGFIISDHFDRIPAFLAEVGPLVASGKLKYRETMIQGIENAPSAFIGLLSGENFGKMLVKVGPGPTEA